MNSRVLWRLARVKLASKRSSSIDNFKAAITRSQLRFQKASI